MVEFPPLFCLAVFSSIAAGVTTVWLEPASKSTAFCATHPESKHQLSLLFTQFFAKANLAHGTGQIFFNRSYTLLVASHSWKHPQSRTVSWVLNVIWRALYIGQNHLLKSLIFLFTLVSVWKNGRWACVSVSAALSDYSIKAVEHSDVASRNKDLLQIQENEIFCLVCSVSPVCWLSFPDCSIHRRIRSWQMWQPHVSSQSQISNQKSRHILQHRDEQGLSSTRQAHTDNQLNSAPKQQVD